MILVLGYYRCPMLCTMINDGLINALENLRANAGADFDVVELSIDPDKHPLPRQKGRRFTFVATVDRVQRLAGIVWSEMRRRSRNSPMKLVIDTPTIRKSNNTLIRAVLSF